MNPYIYEVEPTNYCPYKCIMCPRGLGRMRRSVGYMEMDTLSFLIKQFPVNQKLVRLHHFGEAVLHPEIDTMIRMVADAGLISVLSVNPATLSSALIRKIINSGIHIICFSLDALSDEGLRQIRGIKRSFEACWTMIEEFIENSRESGAFILKIIQMIRLKHNEVDREDFWKIKDKYPESDVYLYLTDNNGFGDVNLIEKTTPGGSANISSALTPCGAPFSEVSILWNGDVALCCYDYDGFNIIGNILEKPLSEIWQDNKVKEIRGLFETGQTRKLPLCANCFLAPHHFPERQLLSRKGWEEEVAIMDIFEKAMAKS
jgi:radical SAM protein with 4Fe4S-binding SPASM domain